MFCLVLKVLHSKSVNVIPSSCIYKLSQNSNYEIGDFFTTRVYLKIMSLSFNGTSTNVWTTIAIPPCTSNTSNQFFVQCKMHIHYIWILVTLFLQIKFKLFINNLYLYVHLFPMPMSYIHGS
jgi:hypothetical protein